MFKLVIQDDEGKTTVVPLIRDEITIGRKEGNTIRLTERNVSRRHARILRNNGEVQIEDLGSYNGIRVNNARIAERVSLRVSDQVQIGDYKLYLKAEGVEQVDEARTMPIERVDSAMQNAPTDVIPAVAAVPTQPMGIPATPAPGTPGRLVGDPNRTLVSVADTDPQGRPVASAATVAALTAPVGYGKLVVLSNNFAGTEFELSRPQMIIGRTDENDIVVAHRSISRNHAKLVREPETGRYTISDLQSSNGVRVNGQDYGKVELRRGDVIDLGHVRFRFVEPGEDFLLGRDAVITDVPDVGGKRGLVVGVIMAVVLVAVIVVFVVLRTMSSKDPPVVQGSNGEGTDAPMVAVTPPEDAKDQAVVQPPPVEIDAPQATIKQPNEDTKQLTDTCLKAQADERWDDLIDCAVRLRAVDAKLAGDLTAAGNREISTLPQRTAFDEAIGRNVNNIRRAKAALDVMEAQRSVYYERFRKRYEQAERASVEDLTNRLRKSITRDCKEYAQLVKSETAARGQSIVDQAKARAGTCTPVKIDPCKQDPKAPGCGGGEPVPPPPTACDAQDLQAKGTDAYAGGSYSQALKFFEQAFACKPDNTLAQRAFMSACKLANRARAKYYYRKAPTEAEKALSICVGLGITKEELTAP